LTGFGSSTNKLLVFGCYLYNGILVSFFVSIFLLFIYLFDYLFLFIFFKRKKIRSLPSRIYIHKYIKKLKNNNSHIFLDSKTIIVVCWDINGRYDNGVLVGSVLWTLMESVLCSLPSSNVHPIFLIYFFQHKFLGPFSRVVWPPPPPPHRTNIIRVTEHP
jgi:hypothetical protein